VARFSSAALRAASTRAGGRLRGNGPRAGNSGRVPANGMDVARIVKAMRTTEPSSRAGSHHVSAVRFRRLGSAHPRPVCSTGTIPRVFAVNQ
jgi:hypothetical protein